MKRQLGTTKHYSLFREVKRSPSSFRFFFDGACRNNTSKRILTVRRAVLEASTWTPAFNGKTSRYLSSGVDDIWKQTSARLLDAPRGAFDDHKLRKECHMTILFWINNDLGVEGIRMAFALLYRISDENVENGLEDAGDDNDLQNESHTKEIFDTNLLNLVVNQWRKIVSGNPSLLNSKDDLSPRLLAQKMKKMHFGHSKLKPDIQTFTMIIDGASNYSLKTNHPTNGVRVGEDILDWLIDSSKDYPYLLPNVFTFSTLMNCWVKSGKAEAPEEVESYLELMHDLDVAPNQVTYATAIDCWAQRGRIDRVEALLQEMHEEFSGGNKNLKPNLPAFNGYLVALAKAGEANKAQSILEQMEQLFESGALEERPTVISYSTVLSSFVNSNINGAAERAESILRRMIDQGISPNAVSYNSVINAYINVQNLDRAESLLKEMHEGFLQGNVDVRPTVQTYTLVLSGWSKTRSLEAAERGEKLLQFMKDLAESGEIESPPDIVAYNVVLDGWAKSSARDSVVRARTFLESMSRDGVDPDTFSYNILIRAMTRSGDIRGAEAVFKTMSDVGVESDITTYNTLLAYWSKSELKQAYRKLSELFSRIEANEDIHTDLITKNTMLQFYSRSGNANRAEVLLDEMCQHGSTVRADSISFNTVISAWSRSRREDAPQRAEIILDKMLEAGGKVRANAITFNAVMGAWVRSKSPLAHKHCERLFTIMNEMYQDGDRPVKPDCVTYNTLIQAWALSSLDEAPDRAEAIFNEMKRRSTPNSKAYGAMIGVWSRSKRSDAGERAESYLRELIEKACSGELEEGPRVHEFTSTIRAWSNSGEPNAIYKADEILHLLLLQYQEEKRTSDSMTTKPKTTKPDSRLFKVILKLLASSHLRGKPKYADKILKLMKHYEVKPDRVNVQLLELCYNERIQNTEINIDCQQN